ncbi:MAG TPA: cell surface protein SprA, partial [Bacteroidales bacterium]|nr:cell surface protein SprA [Bacteroidales bacterium]
VYEDRDILLDSTVSKDFIWNRGYELNWDLTRSVKFDFTINNISRIDELPGAYDWFRSGNNSEWSRAVWDTLLTGGRPVLYNHRFNATYTLPLNKIPLLSWTSTNLRYNAGYDWRQGPIFQGSRTLGNEITNSNTIQANSTFNLTSLYNKSKYLKKLETKYAPNKKNQTEKNLKTVTYTRENFFLRPNTPRNISHKLNTRDISVKVTNREGQEIETDYQVIDENKISIEADTNYNGLQVVIEGKVETGEKPLIFLAENSIRFLTGLKNVTLSYSLTGGTNLAGFMPAPDVAGFNTGSYKGAPGLPFLIGIQDRDFAKDAAANGWLTINPAFTKPFTMSKTETFNIKGTFEPFKGFRIDLAGSRSYTEFNSEYFHFSDSVPGMGGFYFDNHLVNGGFSISVITIGSAFEKLKSSNGYRSETFERFKQYRTTISERLSLRREEQTDGLYQSSLQHKTEEGYKLGYGSTSPEVIIPAFLAAYTGKDPHKVSLNNFQNILDILPNWSLTFDGLPKLQPVDRVLKSATLRHTYRSIYSINSYASHFMFVADEIYGIGHKTDLQDNFVPELQMNSVSIREDLDPLFAFDGTWINNLITRFEYRKSRLLALSLSNNQLTESLNDEIIVGAGYRFSEVPLKIGERAYESDLDVKFNLSMRDNKTIVRYLAKTEKDENDQITMGERIFRIEFTADYLLSPRFNLRFFFDRTLNKPHTSRAFLRVDTNIGFSLRFTLTQ